MKNIKLMLLTVTAMLLLGTANINAQESSSTMVIIRVTEIRGGIGKSSLVTTDMEGNTSMTELKKGLDETGENAILLQKELQKWRNDGYKITNFSTSGATQYDDFPVFRTTIILEK